MKSQNDVKHGSCLKFCDRLSFVSLVGILLATFDLPASEKLTPVSTPFYAHVPSLSDTST